MGVDRGAAALEIAVQDAAGARVAVEHGADRVELCTALGATGGLTPSAGTIAAACATGAAVHVLIRSRPGGFVYSADEVRVLADDVRRAVDGGAAGVVIGALTADARVDVEATRVLADAARSAGAAQVTFHRALDAAADPLAAIALLADLGVDRVLTSGGAAAAPDGLDVLCALVAAGSGVEVMAGGGVRPESIAALVAAGVDAVHLSAKSVVPDPGEAGPGGGAGGGLEITDPSLVAAARAAIDAAGR